MWGPLRSRCTGCAVAAIAVRIAATTAGTDETIDGTAASELPVGSGGGPAQSIPNQAATFCSWLA